jgi:hypothetical protein
MKDYGADHPQHGRRKTKPHLSVVSRGIGPGSPYVDCRFPLLIQGDLTSPVMGAFDHSVNSEPRS